jgi:hypothetical protein
MEKSTARQVYGVMCNPARQPHRKHRDGYVAAHHARELARDGEPEPSAPEALRGRGIGLAELLE